MTQKLGTNIQASPTYLLVGPHEEIFNQAIIYLQKYLCADGGCGTCFICGSLLIQQYHATTWIAPQKAYTLDQLEIIFNTIAFMRDEGDYHFFIIQKADLLTPSCANSLLKILEEPPHGYRFILLAERLDQVLPTVRSRCIVDFFHAPKKYEDHHEIFRCFSDNIGENPNEFLKILDQSKISDQETVDSLDRLMIYWLAKSKNTFLENQTRDYERIEKIVTILKNAYHHLPMPGSSKLFWKNLYLQIAYCL